MVSMAERRERLAAAMAIQGAEDDREDLREVLFLRQNDGNNHVDDRLIGLSLNASCGLFALFHGKLAHLQEGDPFKEKINLYCYNLGYYLKSFLEYLVVNIDEPDNDNVDEPKTFKGKMKNALTFMTSGGKTWKKKVVAAEVPKHPARVSAIRLRFPILENYTGELLNMTATGRNAEAIARVNRQNRVFQILIMDGFENEQNDAHKRLLQIREIHQRIDRIVNHARQASRAYFVDRLQCVINVEAKVSAVFERYRTTTNIAFDFGELSNLSRDITREVRTFYHVTEGLQVVTLLDDGTDDDYRAILTEVIERNGSLDPFGVDALLRREQDPPTPIELINLGVIIHGGRN